MFLSTTKCKNDFCGISELDEESLNAWAESDSKIYVDVWNSAFRVYVSVIGQQVASTYKHFDTVRRCSLCRIELGDLPQSNENV